MINTYVNNKLKCVTDNNWDVYRSLFNHDYELFRDCLERTYSYIANRTIQKILKDDIDFNTNDLFRLQPIDMSSSNFKDLFSRYRNDDGTLKRVNYSTLIHILVAEGIVHQNNVYSANGKTKSNKTFCKSYCLTNSFIIDVTNSEGFDRNNLYQAFNAYYPNRLLKKTAEKVKKLFEEAKKCTFKETLDFEDSFFDKYSTFGWYFGDERLDVEEMVRDLNVYIKHNSGHYVDNRFYDWFTCVSSAFRSHLKIGDKHYREAYDFHAGMYWMLSIYGFLNGKIELDETERMIQHAFFGNFYEDISEEQKTKEVKTKFMVYANSHKGIHKLRYEANDLTFSKISENFWKHYPQWTKMMNDRRNELKGDVGFANFIESTKIEKDLYERIEKKLIELGLTDVKRVHDAIYTLDDVDDIEYIVSDTVDEYMADMYEKEQKQ